MGKNRESFSSKIGFILSSLGGALGLGAMWKLPYTIGQNGGGAFILLFLVFNFFIGLPLYLGELILGRQSQKGIVSSFLCFSKKESSWALVGWLTVLVVLLILGWYCVVAGWSIAYIILALSDAFKDLNLNEIGQIFEIFRSSGSLNILFQTIFIGLNASILLKGLTLGIEKWSKFMTTALFLVLMGLSIYSMQLEGFSKAIEYIIYPDFNALSPYGILQALGLAFFTLNIGYGANITYGSYLTKNADIPKTASIVVLANLLASVLIAITIFPMIFTFGIEPQSGEGLIFKTLPFVFEKLPGSMILGLVFFILLLFAALTSSLAMFEVVILNFTDLFHMPRTKAVFIATLLVFVLGIPVALTGHEGLFPDWEAVFGDTFMNILDSLIDWLLVFAALFTTIFIGYFLPANIKSAGFSPNGPPSVIFYNLWLFLIKVLGPVAILLVMAHRSHLLTF